MNTLQQLTLNDLSSIKELLNTACIRGAFKAQEMSTVGAVYDKLENFLNFVISQAEAQAQANNQGEKND